MARNPFKLPIPKAYNDPNLNSALPMPSAPGSLPSDRAISPASLAAPKSPTSIDQGSLSPRAARFRRLAGILGPRK